MKNAVIGVLATLVVLMGGYLVYDKVIDKKDSGVVDNKTQSDDSKKSGEIELIDATLKSDLSEKVDIMNWKSIPSEDENNKYSTTYLFREISSLNQLSNDDKLIIVLEGLHSRNKFSFTSRYSKDLTSGVYDYIKGYVNDNGVIQIDIEEISSTLVNSEYKRIFGTNITEHKSIEENCPAYIYDSTSQKYYWIEPQCGGATGTDMYSYKRYYSKNNDEAYVYVIYAEVTEGESFVINESNYKKYDEYKYTFKNDSTGNYYFVKVEKVR